MICKSDVEKAEVLERKVWEVQHAAQSVATSLCTVVHGTAERSTKALAQEIRLSAQGKSDSVRAAYVRAKSGVLKARLRLQLQSSAKEIEQVRRQLLELAQEVDLGPLLDSAPE